MTGTPHRTPLHESHVRLGARMVDFHGWEMPIQYSGIVEEHTAVRTRAGLFDLSHMGRVRVAGPARRAFLQRILTINVDKVAPGRCKYTFFLTERGTTIDDLVFYADPQRDLLVVNASNREKDLDWLRRHAPAEGVTLQDETFDVALVAVQGPRSVEIVRKALGIDPSGLRYYSFGAFGEFLVSRTGYTGEDGFEIFVPKARAAETWERLSGAGAPPAGLGARDTLRTEAGMPLYGNELDETTTPLEAGLDFAVDLKKPDFIGAAALRTQGPPSRRLAGLVLESRRIPRTGYEVFREGRAVGRVTSGTFGPTVGRSIAMAYLPAELARPGEAVEIDIRGRREPARVVALPFYRREKT
ncbi:MAG TPA: glycine cleavage system aminomethyltransferase GcvT [Planctomycetota bacterium]|nr:glycine cleavage system aminomethyltransferase GcvT [Planctomycetota bacterium]